VAFGSQKLNGYLRQLIKTRCSHHAAILRRIIPCLSDSRHVAQAVKCGLIHFLVTCIVDGMDPDAPIDMYICSLHRAWGFRGARPLISSTPMITKLLQICSDASGAIERRILTLNLLTDMSLHHGLRTVDTGNILLCLDGILSRDFECKPLVDSLLAMSKAVILTNPLPGVSNDLLIMLAQSSLRVWLSRTDSRAATEILIILSSFPASRSFFSHTYRETITDKFISMADPPWEFIAALAIDVECKLRFGQTSLVDAAMNAVVSSRTTGDLRTVTQALLLLCENPPVKQIVSSNAGFMEKLLVAASGQNDTVTDRLLKSLIRELT